MNAAVLSDIDLTASKGFDAAVLKRFARRIDDDVDNGVIAGAVTYVMRDSVPVLKWAQGWQDAQARRPMAFDSVFWVASMTKPVCCAAALALVDDGLLQLDDPVAKHLPSFGDLRTADRPAHPVGHTMTVRDLMRHTSGLTYGHFGDSSVQQAYKKADVYDFGQSNAQLVEKLSTLPLLYAPGSTFEYGMSTDVLGCVIEACTGQALDVVIAERITGPLGMADTQFRLGARQLDRVARPLLGEDFTMAPPATNDMAWISGGGGLWSTASDYARFATMLLQRGCYAGRRVLSEDRVIEMLSRQLPDGVRFGTYVPALGACAPTAEMGQTFGLGVSVRLGANRNPLPGSAGDFTWPGLSGCNFWCDPAQGLVVVQLIQSPSQRGIYRSLARQALYQALVQ